MTARLVYPVKEAFLTLQGEGAHAGARAVFVRFAGCNVWSGREAHRERDAAKGCCAVWCDTDFVGTNGVNGGSYGATALANTVRKLWDSDDTDHFIVVLTGGEPGLVVDESLVIALHFVGARVHIETNGSCALPLNLDWVTLSPKPPMPVVLTRADEVKCVLFPGGFAPLAYEALAPRRFVQPMDAKDELVNADNIRAATEFAKAHPGWRLSLQTHKLAGIP